MVEGSPGYGKTTLARNIAVDWGLKAGYLSEFKLLIFIYCRDLKGKTIESYVEETYPAMDQGNKKIKLKDWSDIRKDILFILDGLDECSPDDAKEINNWKRGHVKSVICLDCKPLGHTARRSETYVCKR